MNAPLAAAAAAAAAASDIRDIRGPVAIPCWWLPYAIAAGAICVVALGYGVYRRVRRRRADRVRSATEIALERIDRAAARARTGEHTSSGLSADLSDAVRTYIEVRFALNATQRTTEEFLHQLLAETTSPIAAQRAALEEFLSWCDLAKFAQLAVTGEHADALVAAARQVVEATGAPSAKPAAGAPRRSFLRRRGSLNRTSLATSEVGT